MRSAPGLSRPWLATIAAIMLLSSIAGCRSLMDRSSVTDTSSWEVVHFPAATPLDSLLLSDNDRIDRPGTNSPQRVAPGTWTSSSPASSRRHGLEYLPSSRRDVRSIVQSPPAMTTLSGSTTVTSQNSVSSDKSEMDVSETASPPVAPVEVDIHDQLAGTAIARHAPDPQEVNGLLDKPLDGPSSRRTRPDSAPLPRQEPKVATRVRKNLRPSSRREPILDADDSGENENRTPTDAVAKIVLPAVKSPFDRHINSLEPAPRSMMLPRSVPRNPAVDPKPQKTTERTNQLAGSQSRPNIRSMELADKIQQAAARPDTQVDGGETDSTLAVRAGQDKAKSSNTAAAIHPAPEAEKTRGVTESMVSREATMSRKRPLSGSRASEPARGRVAGTKTRLPGQKSQPSGPSVATTPQLADKTPQLPTPSVNGSQGKISRRGNAFVPPPLRKISVPPNPMRQPTRLPRVASTAVSSPPRGPMAAGSVASSIPTQRGIISPPATFRPGRVDVNRAEPIRLPMFRPPRPQRLAATHPPTRLPDVSPSLEMVGTGVRQDRVMLAQANTPAVTPPHAAPLPPGSSNENPVETLPPSAVSPDGGNQERTLGENQQRILETESQTNLQFLREQTILLDPGEYQLDITLQYLTDSDDFAFAAQQNNGLQIGEAQRRQRLLTMPLELRLGITPVLQGFINVPFGWSNNEFSFSGTDEFSNVGGLGDITVGLTRMLVEESECFPTVLTTWALSAPTGNSNFVTSLSTPGSNLGQGFWTLSGDVTFIRTYEPVVLFYGLGYRHRHENTFTNGVTVDPGAQVFYRLGTGFAINSRITASATFFGSYIAESKVNTVRVAGDIREPMQLRFAVTIAQDPKYKKCNRGIKLTEPFVNFGLTDGAVDSVIGISWTR